MAFGLDLAVATEWFGELIDSRAERVVSSYDLLSRDYNRVQPIRGLLLWIGEAAEQYTEAELDECLLVILTDKLPSDGPECFGFVYWVLENLARASRYHGI